MSIELVIPSNHVILCCPLLPLPSIFPSIRVFSSESVLHIRWSKYWSFSFSISPFNEYSTLISFRIDWFDLLAVQRTLKSLPQKGLLAQQAMAAAAATAAKSLQLCLTLCDPRDCSPPGSPIPGILQARTLEWVAISFSNAWKWKVKVKSLGHVWLFATPWTAAYQAPLSMGFSRQEYWSGLPLPSPQAMANGYLTTVQKHQFLALSFLYGPTLTSIHGNWKNHSFDYMDLCRQSNVSTI